MSARFQARSALSGVGFTTSEAENVVNHPVRRRIIMGLMLVGNVGLVTAVAGLLSSFLNTPNVGRGTLCAVLLIRGLAGVYLLSKSGRVDRVLSQFVHKLLEEHTDIDVRDDASILHVGGDCAVKEVKPRAGSWLTEQTLGELRLREQGVIVLGINRADGNYEGVPRRDSRIRPGDTAIIYARTDTVREVATRRGGSSGGSSAEYGDADHVEPSND